jgi:acyl-CoA dehydrogenase
MDRSDLADVLAAVRDFVRKEVVPIEEQIDAEDAIPRRVITTCKEMGLYGFAIPQEYGGLGMTLTEEAQLAFELGWTTPALRSLFGTNNGIAGQVLLVGGTEDQKEDWLPRLASGEVTASFGLTRRTRGPTPPAWPPPPAATAPTGCSTAPSATSPMRRWRT